jgi:glycosyltransferase involved in cell wall biosynthesis
MNILQKKLDGTDHLSMPLVSVIVPTYNFAEYIAETIEAILAQTFGDLELVIIDDCSHDGTQTIITDYASRDSRIIPIFKERNEGPASARNTGMKNSRGEFIAFCDADDVWEKNKLELQLDVFATYEDYDVVYSDAFIINSKGEKTGKRFSEKYPTGKKLTGNLFDELCLTNMINTQTVIMKKKCVHSAGYFPEEVRGLEDWVYWVKVAEKHKFFYINQPLARYRVHEKSINRNIKTFTENRIKAIHIILKTFPNLKRGTKSKLYYGLSRGYVEIEDKNKGRESIIQSIRHDASNIKSWYRLLSLLFCSRR